MLVALPEIFLLPFFAAEYTCCNLFFTNVPGVSDLGQNIVANYQVTKVFNWLALYKAKYSKQFM